MNLRGLPFRSWFSCFLSFAIELERGGYLKKLLLDSFFSFMATLGVKKLSFFILIFFDDLTVVALSLVLNFFIFLDSVRLGFWWINYCSEDFISKKGSSSCDWLFKFLIIILFINMSVWPWLDEGIIFLVSSVSTVVENFLNLAFSP